MSANKTGGLLNWFIGITFIYSLSLAVIFFTVPRIDGLSPSQQVEQRNQALKTAATIFLGFGVAANAYLATKQREAMEQNARVVEKNNQISIKNAELAEQQLVQERLAKAIAQLGHPSTATRIGAIYCLEAIATDSPKEHWMMMEIVSAFIKENAPAVVCEEMTQEATKIGGDIQAALTMLGRRSYFQDPEKQKLDLRNIDIRKADLRGANLQSIDLRGADLSCSDLRGAQLTGVDLDRARLCSAVVCEANLDRANLRGANLTGANLNRASLCEANLRDAKLETASLRGCNLTGANLYKANLYLANLNCANLAGAKLFLANLQGAKLDKANIHGTGLIGANLQQANLNGANLQQANLNAAKLQQTEVFFANLSGASLTEANLHGANLMGANLQGAVLDEANLSGANLIGANLDEANLNYVKLEGAILTGAKNLDPQQILVALGDRNTRLPDNVEIPIHWRQSS